MSKTIIVTTDVTLNSVQHSVIPATMMETPEGPVTLKPRYIDSSTLSLSIVMVTGGEFDARKTGALLKAIMDKLAEVEL